MKNLQLILHSIPILLCLLFTQIAYGQSYSKTIFNNGNSSVTVNGFPDIACPVWQGGFHFSPNDNCSSSNTCLNGVLNAVNPLFVHQMDIEDTIDFSLTLSTNSIYDFTNITVYHVSRLGLPEQTVTALTSTALFCAFPPCSENIIGSISPTSGGLNDAIVVELTGVGSYILPMRVTGPILTEVAILGSIITPQIPYLILHDPPGDESFSSFEASTTICRSSSTSYEESNGGGFTATAKVGVAGSIGIILEQDFEFSVAFTNDFSMNHTNTNTIEEERCVETVSSFATSSLPDITGDDADVFVGYGETLFWGVFDIVIPLATCFQSSPGTKHGLAYYPDPDGYTQFTKTASDIQADIDLQLAKAEDMSNDLETRTRAYNQVEVWEDVLALNAMNVANATEFIGNYNFSGGGVPSTYSNGVTTTQVQTTSYNVAVSNTSSIDVVAIVGANGFTGGPQFTFSKNEGMTTSSSTNNSEIISYHLEDGDTGDVFNCSAFRDPTYGTPIFRLTPGSKTSCPYEGAIQRDQPIMNWNSGGTIGNFGQSLYTNLNNNVTSFQLDLCNNSNEERIYQLSIVGNNNNATVTEGGVTLNNTVAGNTDHTIGAGTCKTVTIGFIGNPTGANNNVHNISFLLSPQCGGFPDVETDEATIVTLFVTADDTDGDGILNNLDLCPNTKDLALEFDGIDDACFILFDNPSNSLIIDGDFAFEAWVHPKANKINTILLNGSSGSSYPSIPPHYVYRLDGLNNLGKQSLGLTVDGVVFFGHSTSPVPLDTWSHIAVSFDWESKTATFYLNGIVDGQQNFPLSENYSSVGSASVYLGTDVCVANTGTFFCNGFQGTLDELIIWDKARIAENFVESMAVHRTGSELGLMHYLDFTEENILACESGGFGSSLDKGPNGNFLLMRNFDREACMSNYVSGPNIDTNGDGSGAACDDSIDQDMDGHLDGSDLCPTFTDVALDFDGTDDHIEISHDPILNVVDGDFAFEAWVYPTEDKVNTIISKGAGGANTSFIYNLFGSSDGLGHTQGLYLTIDNSGVWHTSSTTVPLDQWSHVAVSFDWDTKVASFYLNGMPDGSGSYDVNGNYYNIDLNSMYIGRQGWSCNCNFFHGRLDDVSVWDKELTQVEVEEHMSTRMTTQPPNLIALYDLNDGTACEEQGTDYTENFVSNDIDGTLQNFSFSGCTSNWTSGRNLDSDGDGVGDSCDNDFCAPDYAGTNSLSGIEVMMYGMRSYHTIGNIQSTQTIGTQADVEYNAGTTIELNANFEVQDGAVFHAFIDGCGSNP